MIIISWNCRGLGSPAAVRQLSRLAKACNPQLLFLSETKLYEGEAETLKWKLGFECGVFMKCDGFGRSRSGGIALFWRRDLNVNLMSMSLHHVDVEIGGNNPWRFTGMYGWPRTEERRNTWDLMRSLRDKSELPWLCGGDLNEILSVTEKRGGQAVHHNRIAAFHETLLFCNLTEVPQEGILYTWSNGQEGEDHIECKLDRYVANQSWWDLFPASKAEAWARINSDHSPIICRPAIHHHGRLRKRRFRFEAMWTRHIGLSEQIQKGWNLLPNDATLMERSTSCAKTLQRWDREEFGNVSRKVKELERQIAKTQAEPLTHDRKEIIAKLMKERDEMLTREEIMWAQRARVEWLKEGDRNTRFFHKKSGHRQKRNSIEEIKNNEGVVVKEEVGIRKIFEEFYVSLFSSTGNVRSDSITSKVTPKVTASMNTNLCEVYRPKEILEALQQMHPTKAPGPDGLPPLFFQRYWQIVGPEVLVTALAILNDGADPSPLNETIVALIPKVKLPTTCSEYRPISLCNVIMRIITKTIANRLKRVLPDVIHENQSAFVPGRLITDNSLIALEVFHYLKTKTTGRKGFCALKLDMMKAYDRVEWSFLEDMMTALGFRQAFIRLIMSEGLAALLSHAAQDDDSLLFSRATMTELNNIMELLAMYETASGQKVNIQKSSIKFSRNIPLDTQQQMCLDIGMKLATDEEHYLGLPTTVGRSKKAIFANLEERIRNKVGNWKVRFLSKTGREVLIKAVLQSIPTYVMSCFTLPLDTCERIEQRLCDFYWGSMNGERKLHWRSWAKMCRPKNEGGLGFRRIHSFNKAMLAKQAWRLITNPHSLMAKIYKARYFPRTPFRESKDGYRTSHAWQSIKRGLALLDTGLEWRVGNGESVKIWQDKWLPGARENQPLYAYPGSDTFQLVSDLIVSGTSQWNEELLGRLFTEEDIARVKQIRLSQRLPDDILRWKHSENGEYVVRSGYYQDLSNWWTTISNRLPLDPSSNLWNNCWKIGGPPRLLNFLWRLLDSNLPVRVNLRRRGLQIDDTCPLCQNHEETIMHLFVNCPISKALLTKVGFPDGLRYDLTFGEAWNEFVKTQGKVRSGRLNAAFWGLWKFRNTHVFGSPDLQNQDKELLKAISFYEDFLANQGSNSVAKTGHPTTWVPPPEGMLKINTDAGVQANGGGQISAIARNHRGEFIRAAVQQVPTIQHPTLLEAHGILLGLTLAKELMTGSVIVESDCLPLVQALQDRRLDRGDLAIILEDCMVAALEVGDVAFSFTPRTANRPAHQLAKSYISAPDIIHYMSVLPPDISTSLVNDVSTLF